MGGLKNYLFRIGTPLTAGLFLVSTVSGVALFFGLAPGLFHEMHEVLSMALIAPFLVHVWRNWKPLVGYFRRAAMPIALALSLVAAGYFALGASGSARGGNPALALVAAAQQVPVATLAPVLKLDPAAITQRLDEAGFGPVQPGESVAAIAARTGRSSMEVLAKLTTPPAASAAN